MSHQDEGSFLNDESPLKGEAILERLKQATRMGVPLGPALRSLAQESVSSRTRFAIHHLITQLDQGKALASSMANLGGRVGAVLTLLEDESLPPDQFDGVLYCLIEQTGRKNEFRREMFLSILYPTFLISASFLIIGFVLLTIVPQFRTLFSDFGISLPVFTRFMITISDFCSKYWIPVAIAITVVLVLQITIVIRFLVHLSDTSWISRIPLIGSPCHHAISYCFRRASLADFCRILSIFIDANIPLNKAIRVASASSTDPWLMNAGVRWAGDIENGFDPVSSGVILGFPQVLSQTLSTASSPKILADSLRGLGDVYSARIQVGMRTFLAFIEPASVMFVVISLGTIVIALFWPVIQLINDLT